MRKNAIRLILSVMVFMGACSVQFQGPFPPQWPPHSIVK